MSATETKTVAGLERETDARLLQFEWKQRLRGLTQDTIRRRKGALSKLIIDGADLSRPETIDEAFATHDYTQAQRYTYRNAYRAYCRTFGLVWDAPRVRYSPAIPWVPTPTECLIFIAGLKKTLSIFCRVLYETGARSAEAHAIEWKDIDERKHTIAINHAGKGSNPRIIEVSTECIRLIKTMFTIHGSHIFNPRPRSYDAPFGLQRKQVADKTGNPKFLEIHFHTFRHARATHDRINGVPLEEVQYKLGHKSLLNTERYDHLVKALKGKGMTENSFYSTTCTSDEEADKLIENGWQHVCNNPATGRMHFRKPKCLGD